MTLSSSERVRQWRAENPAHSKQQQHEYYLKNRKKILSRNGAYAEKHKERIRGYSQRYRGLPEPTRPEPIHCECCGRAPMRNGRLELDHDHVTGAFRGWLCHRCNLGIGNLQDSRAGIRLADEYLERAECQTTQQILPSPSLVPEPQLNSGT